MMGKTCDLGLHHLGDPWKLVSQNREMETRFIDIVVFGAKLVLQEMHTQASIFPAFYESQGNPWTLAIFRDFPVFWDLFYSHWQACLADVVYKTRFAAPVLCDRCRIWLLKTEGSGGKNTQATSYQPTNRLGFGLVPELPCLDMGSQLRRLNVCT